MNVFLNDILFTLDEGSTVQNLLDKAGITEFSGTAIAVSNAIIKKDDWQKHLLRENDKILVIRAASGG